MPYLYTSQIGKTIKEDDHKIHSRLESLKGYRTELTITNSDFCTNTTYFKDRDDMRIYYEHCTPYLRHAIIANDTLLKLTISLSLSGRVGLKYIAEAIEKNCGIETLDLSDWFLYDYGRTNGRDEGNAILEKLIKNKTLNTLILVNCNICDDGVEILARSNKLKVLNLTGNRQHINIAGLLALASSASVTNLSVTHSYNDKDKNDAQLLDSVIQAFANNTTLEYLELNNLPFTKERLKILEQSKTLKSFKTNNKEIQEELALLNQVLSQNFHRIKSTKVATQAISQIECSDDQQVITALKQENTDLHTQLQQKDDKIQDLQKELTELHNQINLLEVRSNDLEKILQGVKTMIDSAKIPAKDNEKIASNQGFFSNRR